jgi:hypothetical protein
MHKFGDVQEMEKGQSCSALFRNLGSGTCPQPHYTT